MKEIGLNGVVYDFSIEYGVTQTKDILNVYDYFVTKKQYKIILRFVKLLFVVRLSFGRLLVTQNVKFVVIK